MPYVQALSKNAMLQIPFRSERRSAKINRLVRATFPLVRKVFALFFIPRKHTGYMYFVMFRDKER
jgi:hypothetical protein